MFRLVTLQFMLQFDSKIFPPALGDQLLVCGQKILFH